MTLLFGLELDDLTLPRPDTEGGVHYCGRKSLLSLLESYLGLDGHPDNIDYLRIEQYRQAVISWQLAIRSAAKIPNSLRDGSSERSEDPELASGRQSPFFQKSFEADQFATAAELLSRRDELLLAGWDFEKKENTPPRLATLAEIEAIFHQSETPQPPITDHQSPITLTPGYAGRFVEVMKTLDFREHPFTEIRLNEPLELLPCHFQRLLKKMSETSARPAVGSFERSENPELASGWQSETSGELTDLQKFQRRLANDDSPGGKSEIRNLKSEIVNDGSLLLLRAKRAGEAAAWLAQLFRLNPGISEATGVDSEIRNPKSEIALLVPEKNRTLDIALIHEGLPSLGIQSASLARPSLQILKLAPTFLWEPVDPFKILEFVSLSVKPLADDLATLIANQVAKQPGLRGDGWFAMIARYFSELEERAAADPHLNPSEVRRQYNFWFERQRYDLNRTVPKGEVVQVFNYLREWAYATFDENGGKKNSLLVLSEQSKRIVELLEALPETELTHLELERIVRTIYEPSPVVFQEREVGHLPFVTHPGAFTGGVEEVWWWNFIQNDPPHFFSRWYQNERDYLKKLDISPDTPEQENARMLWQQRRPVLLAKNRIVLVLPETVNGEDVLPHPLFGDLQAAFANLETISADLNYQSQITSHQSPFAKHFILPEKEKVEVRQLGRPKPFLHVRNLDKLQREYETLTSLESLFYYPYQWVFRYKIRLNKSSILSVAPDNTLMGNLAHRVFEKLLKEDIHQLDKPSLEQWIERETRRLLAREGAVLLMYGREPDRINFVNKLKYSAWSLISYIRENGWKVRATEMELEGFFPVDRGSGDQSTPVRGIADIVLERGDELAVLDLKWRGSARREAVLRNEEDLQLALYARLVSPEKQWAHTGYFILENGKLLVRNNRAFANIPPLAPGKDHREVNESILQKMEATWHWRMAQLAKGQIEIRCRQTLLDIEDAYSSDGQGEQMFDILEMKGEDAKWDDYRTLINLIE